MGGVIFKMTDLPSLKDVDFDHLVQLVDNQPVSVDQLPYTEEFEEIYEKFGKRFYLTRPELWRWIIKMRKNGDLKRKGIVSKKEIVKRQFAHKFGFDKS